MGDRLATGIHGGFAAVAAGFLCDSLAATVPWLLAMFAVILCDLCAALRRCWLTGEAVRLSRAVRATMGKSVTYTAFVLMVCMVETAAGGGLRIDRWACLLVCAVEFTSILGNILRPKGYNVELADVLARMLGARREEKEDEIHDERQGG